MSNPQIPPEILDHIVDNLHNEPDALRNCCLVAKSWIPRTRKHLFADVKFTSPEHLESWKTTFPDPSNSPAHHTRTLSVKCARIVTAEDGEEDGWIRTFSRVVRLDVDSGVDGSEFSPALFRVFSESPILKSLRVASGTLSLPQIFGLVRSLPLLEDLSLVVHGIPNDNDLSVHEPPAVIPTSTSPPFTGTLELTLFKEVEPTTRRLLDLPNGLHFRHLTLKSCQEDDVRWINALIDECSDTLESINVHRRWYGGSTKPSINLSRATRLRDGRFRHAQLKAEWILMALQTVTSEHRDLQRISFHVPYQYTLDGLGANIRQGLGEVWYGQWLDLDRLLVQFWESRSIRPKITYNCESQEEKKEAIDCVSCLLPEITKRGIIDLGLQ